MDLAKITGLAAIAFAVIAGVVPIPESAMIIAILGAASGYFQEADGRTAFLVATLALAAVHGALGSIPGVGSYLTDILGSLSSLFNAASCAIIVMTVVERVKP